MEESFCSSATLSPHGPTDGSQRELIGGLVIIRLVMRRNNVLRSLSLLRNSFARAQASS